MNAIIVLACKRQKIVLTKIIKSVTIQAIIPNPSIIAS
ncbi:hypothetical protein DJ66_0943 [Candidatus Liberibacter solanacearum]|uniref:Uncharacterized protein n=1 Tax=Candidatus Liberibacter solanacearum TaxID=556287 RepID=A0A0F4VL66_9HYPH|nr:hypothetical protein DJ66_0943 [Candidatus Liberibacter solanacearum]